MSDFGDDWLSYSGLKMQVDGGMTLRTADMRDGYPDDPDYHGTVVVSQQRLNQMVAIANRSGGRVDTQSAFLWDKASTIARYLGRETADRAIPVRWMIDHMGMDAVAQGTDYPINPLNPFINMDIM